MEINSRTLRVLCAVMDTNSLAAASARVALSPSAISRVVSRLEQDLGVRLFDRRDRHLAPTAAGQRFHGRAREALLLIDDLTASAKLPEDGIEPLRVAALSRHAHTIVAPALANIIANGSSPGPILFDMHAQRDFGFSRLARPFDIAFGNLVTPRDELEIRLLAQSDLVVAVPPGHRFYRRDILTAADLAIEPMIILSRDTVIGRIVNTALGPAQQTRVVAEVSHTYLAVALVAAGVGLHPTDRLAALDAERQGCALIPIKPGQPIPFSAFWPKRSTPLSPRAETAIDAVEAILTARRLKRAIDADRS